VQKRGKITHNKVSFNAMLHKSSPGLSKSYKSIFVCENFVEVTHSWKFKISVR